MCITAPQVVNVTLDDYPDTMLSAGYAFYAPEDSDDWINTDVPESPYSVFMDSFYGVGDLLAEYGVGGNSPPPHSADLINRMVFTQQVSALEAYLGDTLINAVMSDPYAMSRLLAGDKVMQATSLPIVLFATSGNIVATTVKEYLQSLLYHNLKKVDALYKIVFGFSIWPDASTKDELFRAINVRHDCVHRNGKDRTGKDLDLSTSYVNEMVEATRLLVEHIEQGVNTISGDTSVEH